LNSNSPSHKKITTAKISEAAGAFHSTKVGMGERKDDGGSGLKMNGC